MKNNLTIEQKEFLIDFVEKHMDCDLAFCEKSVLSPIFLSLKEFKKMLQIYNSKQREFLTITFNEEEIGVYKKEEKIQFENLPIYECSQVEENAFDIICYCIEHEISFRYIFRPEMSITISPTRPFKFVKNKILYNSKFCSLKESINIIKELALA